MRRGWRALAIGAVFAVVATGFTIAMAATMHFLARRPAMPVVQNTTSPSPEDSHSPEPITVAPSPGVVSTDDDGKDKGKSGAPEDPPGEEISAEARAEHQPDDPGSQGEQQAGGSGAPEAGAPKDPAGKDGDDQGNKSTDDDAGRDDDEDTAGEDDGDGDPETDDATKTDNGKGNGGTPGNGKGKQRYQSAGDPTPKAHPSHPGRSARHH